MAQVAKFICAVADVRYYTDYSNPAAPIIHLGTVAEAVTKKSRVLAMIGRAKLSANELKMVSGFNREQLINVWGTLDKSFRGAWDRRQQLTEPGALLKYLADAHALSLHFETPQELAVPKSVVETVERKPEALGTEVLTLLKSRLVKKKRPTSAAAHRRQRRGRSSLPRHKKLATKRDFFSETALSI